MKYRITEQAEWRHWVTPRIAKEKTVHRWYLFPHSFTGDLVHALIHEWGLSGQDRILDPFAGSGTTLLAAKEMGVRSDGYDLSPARRSCIQYQDRYFLPTAVKKAMADSSTCIEVGKEGAHRSRLSGPGSQGAPGRTA